MTASHRYHLWFAIAALVGLFALLGTIVVERQGRMDRFAADGVSAQAQVTGRYTETVTMPEGKLPRTWYFAKVHYRVDGRDYRPSARVSYEFYEGLEIGEMVPVSYLRGDPETVLIDPSHEARNLGAIWLLGVGFLCAVGIMVWREMRGGPRRRDQKKQREAARQSTGRKPPRWKTSLSTVLMLMALASFFTVSIWTSRAVEAAAIESLSPALSWLSLPLALAAFLFPPVALGMINLWLMDLPVGREQD